MIVNDFTVIESIHGRFIVNRHCAHQIDYLAKTGAPHIQGEIAAILTIIRTLPDKCVVVDAGANIGLITVPIAHEIKARGGVVHAFEPQRLVYQALCGTSVLNDLNNIFPRHLGLSDRFVGLKMPDIDYSAPADFGMVSLKGAREGGSGTVSVVPLDSVGLSRVDFVKIDVEGMESAILAGAAETLAENRPWVWMEYHMSDIDTLKSAFDGLNYVFYRIDALNMLCAPLDKLERTGIRVQAETI